MAAATDSNKRIKALAGVLNDLVEAHGSLLEVVENKIAAMRAADTERLKAEVAREECLVERINDREGLRHRLSEEIGRGYGIGPEAARRLSASQLAARVGRPYQDKINAAAQRLKDLTGRIARRNRVAQTISQTVLWHVKQVLMAMTVSPASATAYSPGGGLVGAGTRRIFDAVG